MYLLFKRLADIIFSFLLLLIFFPVTLLITLLQARKGKVFFTQQRVGYKGVLFMVYKFQTMQELYDLQGMPLPDAIRITKIGRFLRKTSLDELPQLLNILRGDMSFVGPRPLLPEYVLLYDKRQASRHNVPQGLTGWAQIHGRNALNWQKRLALDAYYAENASFILDIFIIIKTVWLLIAKRNGDVLAEKFKGN